MEATYSQMCGVSYQEHIISKLCHVSIKIGRALHVHGPKFIPCCLKRSQPEGVEDVLVLIVKSLPVRLGSTDLDNTN